MSSKSRQTKAQHEQRKASAARQQQAGPAAGGTTGGSVRGTVGGTPSRAGKASGTHGADHPGGTARAQRLAKQSLPLRRGQRSGPGRPSS
ncbi:hypothetical protein Ppa06_20660 [Planomonospora parontospora subsp. parontospora]|uniref:Uncharacterized protein n=2 Tax=Planomonospora parontospora TaxID=58119 RepID=A0AA37BFE8_9ACTN|nr:hypothetical protein [Planomonospora parontospora]GGK63002.1 hypothetical protein GCM10010126_22890 [Planomonospora parontospora]GII08268.1 hypothetical protein Ppa06_20660 [Planomonospora parontospora subsp. parontospora]